MLRIRANHAHDTLAVNHLALVANFSDRCPNFHCNYRLLVTICDVPMVEIVRRQLNQNPVPERSLIKCLRIFPEICASHLAMTFIASSFAIQQARIRLYWQTSDSSMPRKQLPTRVGALLRSRNSRARGPR